ncbi:ester cyclase [Microbacterium sp. No. 7]|uniref:ester cyclase n=1 Tax=Microbacterium sp. No. 7 TaxID=1714373 RepID=UPI000A6D7918|nr:nuclear transport factor 2 family protein [Microbacterium sp. No. 7]
MMRDHPLTEEFLHGFAQRWESAWNSRDPEQVLALLHPEIEWDDTVFWPEVIRGIPAMRPYLDAIFRAMPDVVFHDVQLFTAPDAGRGIWLFRQEGSGPARYGPGGRFSNHGCDIWLAFRDGLLSSYLSRYDMAEIMRQFHALPPRGDLLGGTYLRRLAEGPPTVGARASF